MARQKIIIMNAIKQLKSERKVQNLKFKKQMALMNRLHQPNACARTSIIKTKDPDLELRETLRHQAEFDLKIQKEIEKLNFPMNYYQKFKKSTKNMQNSLKTKIFAISSVPSTRKHRRVKTVPTSDKRSRRKTLSPKLGPLSSHFKSSTTELPPLIKSTPIHLDPNLKFSKIPKKAKRNSIDCREFLSVVDSVSGKSEDTKRIQSVDTEIRKSTKSTLDFYNWIEHVVESVKFGNQKETYASMMAFGKQVKKLDSSLKKHSDEIRDELQEDTLKLGIKFGIRKIKNS